MEKDRKAEQPKTATKPIFYENPLQISSHNNKLLSACNYNQRIIFGRAIVEEYLKILIKQKNFVLRNLF